MLPETINTNEKITEKKNRKLFFRFVFLSTIFILLILSYQKGFENGKKNTSFQEESFPIGQTTVINKEGSEKYSIDFSLFWRTWDLLKEKYVDSNQLDSKKLFYGAIKGMLSATGDPYTTFFDPEENNKFNEDITGSFEGLGVEIGMKNNILTIIAPLEGTPAEKAGLRAGDKVLKIADKITSDITIDEAVNLMRGPKGTEVKLTILRDGQEETQDITVKRDVINVKSIKYENKDGNIAYIKVSTFGDNTLREFNGALNNISTQKPKGVILDLRNDPGGYLDTAVDIASRMLPKGKVVVIEESQDKKQKIISSRGGDLLSGIKTVVLINEGSASASEILAGALKENRDNVTLVGKKSFGKGSVQELINLPGNTAAKITVAKWLTPKGNQINEKGISPDVEIDLSLDDFQNNRDPQLDKALELLKN
jgi:carboxyl-terminal processing protease